MTDFNEYDNNSDLSADFSAVEDEFIDGFFDGVFEDSGSAAAEASISETGGASGNASGNGSGVYAAAPADVPETPVTADVPETPVTADENEENGIPESAGDAAAAAAADVDPLSEESGSSWDDSEDEIPGADDIISDPVGEIPAVSGPADGAAGTESAQPAESGLSGGEGGEEIFLDGITNKIEIVDGGEDNDSAAEAVFREMEAAAEGTEADAAVAPVSSAGTEGRSFLYRFFHAKKGDPLYIPHEILSYILIIALAFVAAIIINIYIFRLSTVVGDSMNQTFKSGDTVFLSRLPYIFGSPKRGDVIIFDHTGEPRTFAKDWKDSIRSNAIVNFFKKITGKDAKVDEDSHEFYIKRVIGVEGDVILIKDNKVYRSNVKTLGGVFADYYELYEKCRNDPRNPDLRMQLAAAEASFAGLDVSDMSQWEELSEPYVNPLEEPSYSSWEGRLWIVGSGEVFVMGDNRNHSLDSRAPQIGTKPVSCILGKVLGNH